ncbi:TPA: hypothetical protein RQK97_001525 [Vibrio vulnificus]|uniref:hypothetical protein n=1 Tax=Vibrio vulnificus TaxID=672 RepID=UPI000A42B5BF|nr:hypothetical protein [Vibrio vulnificus]HAS6168992.1 hypothetical protein [Vibrio vulnificus]HDY7995275.1 hypothetical protein [Vibrio vulnificus]HDY8106587.1 hypothetical protein [Vibrio vulnificus]
MDKLIQQWQQGTWKEELSSPWVQWGGLGCLVLIIYALIFSPYLEWRSEISQQVVHKSGQYDRLLRIEQSRQEIQNAANTANQELKALQTYLFKSRTHSRGISDQLSAFEDISRSHQLGFSGRRFGEPSIMPWLGENLDAQWRLNGSTDDITAFLYSMAQSKPLIEIQQLEIKPARQTRRSKKMGGYEIALDIRSYRHMPLSELKRLSQGAK